MKVLIVKTSALGDVVHALPVLAWIKSADPAAQIDWLVEKPFASLLEGQPLIRRVLQVDTKQWRKGGLIASVRGLTSLATEIRREAYDVALDLQGNSKSGLLTMLSGARRRYGFARDGVREWPALLATHVKVTLTDRDYHVSERSLAVARAAFPGGNTAPLAGPLIVGSEEQRKLEGLLSQRGLGTRPLVVCHYGTTWVTKLWALENWCSLVQQLTGGNDIDVLLTWGNEEEKSAAEAIAAASAEQARGTLKDLVALLERADLAIGCDTGPIHIAAAVGTPTVSIYRVTDAYRNGPKGDNHLLLQVPMACAVCMRKQCSMDVECAASITVDEVAEAAMKLLKERGGLSASRGS